MTQGYRYQTGVRYCVQVCASISSGNYAGARITGMLISSKRVPFLRRMLRYDEQVQRSEHEAKGADALNEELTQPSQLDDNSKAQGLALWAGTPLLWLFFCVVVLLLRLLCCVFLLSITGTHDVHFQPR